MMSVRERVGRSLTDLGENFSGLGTRETGGREVRFVSGRMEESDVQWDRWEDVREDVLRYVCCCCVRVWECGECGEWGVWGMTRLW